MSLDRDIDVQEWVYGIIHGEPTPAGDFLRAFAEAVVRADNQSYAALRHAILAIKARFPKYKCRCQSWTEEPSS